MTDRIPYTYFILHIPTGKKYYGSKYGKGASPELFWVPGGYFTSSEPVKKLIAEYGHDSFRAEVRKIFETPDQALKYEYRFLQKINALHKDDWLNENLGGEKFRNVGPASEKALISQRKKKQTPEGNTKRSATLKGRPVSPETQEKRNKAHRDRSWQDEEARRNKIREKATGRGHKPETKANLSTIVSNTRWVNNGTEQKKVDAEDLDRYIQEGWIHGRILKVVTCPYCNATGVKHNIVRRHFEKCIFKKGK